MSTHPVEVAVIALGLGTAAGFGKANEQEPVRRVPHAVAPLNDSPFRQAGLQCDPARILLSHFPQDIRHLMRQG